MTQTMTKPAVPLADVEDPFMRLVARLTHQAERFEKRGGQRAKQNAALLREELAFLVG
jgi:hypothetical protein